MPTGTIEHESGVGACGNVPADFLQMQAHGLGIDIRQYQPDADGPLRADYVASGALR